MAYPPLTMLGEVIEASKKCMKHKIFPFWVNILGLVFICASLTFIERKL